MSTSQKKFKARTLRISGTAASAVAWIVFGGLADFAIADAPVRITTLSSSAHTISGDDALVQIEVLEQIAGATLAVSLNGSDVSDDFDADSSGRLIGKVDGLLPGNNELAVQYGAETSIVTLTSYAIEGPVISGPHEIPFVCTSNFVMPTGVPALTKIAGDPDCGVVTRVDYLYRNTSNQFVYIPNPGAPYPNDVRKITVNNVQVPYVVRLESGTINRAIYQSAILHNVVGEAAPGPLTRPAGWTGKLIYRFGGGCEGGWFQQGGSMQNVLDDNYLSRGYAVATSTLNVMGQNCNDQLSSETVMMVKERFIENYGAPIYTVAIRGSGGSYQSNQTGDNYPGLIDGIIISQTFPDVTSATLFKLFDSRLLKLYFDKTSLGDTKKKAISGYRQSGNIAKMSTEANRIDPVVSFPAGVTAGVGPTYRYHATSNREGARATVYDHTQNVYGVTNEGHALRPIDNVGVQYGLTALNEGKITKTDFINLNKGIGGLDRDLKRVAQRTLGDEGAIERAYRSGRIVSGGGGLAAMPIIDRRDYNDNASDIHASIHSFSLRERLLKANGSAANHVILRSTDGGDFGVDSLTEMDKWLSAVQADASGLPLADKVRNNKPATLVDSCKIGTEIVREPQTAFGTSRCNKAFPVARTPRMAAGGPLADNVVKCVLKPVDTADYTVSFSSAQLTQLRTEIFPDGVCDWNQPGVGQQASQPWRSFGPSPVNLLFDINNP